MRRRGLITDTYWGWRLTDKGREVSVTNVTASGFLITPAWLREVDACSEARDLLGNRTYTVREAFSLALDAGQANWCEWGTRELLCELDVRESCGFAARRARSVLHLVPESAREVCEHAVRCTERVAAGEAVPTRDLHAAASAVLGVAESVGTWAEMWAATTAAATTRVARAARMSWQAWGADKAALEMDAAWAAADAAADAALAAESASAVGARARAAAIAAANAALADADSVAVDAALAAADVAAKSAMAAESEPASRRVWLEAADDLQAMLGGVSV